MEKNTDEHGQAQTGREGLIPKHGGYRRLKTFQLAEAIYDVTVRFCEKYVESGSRTRDQMVQAARSGRQNIAEGSMDSATSKKMELKLTGVAKGSLEELRLDYEDYLRQRGLPRWQADHPALVRFRARRCGSLDEFRRWVADEVERAGGNTDRHGQTRTGDGKQNGRGQTRTADGKQNAREQARTADGNTDAHRQTRAIEKRKIAGPQTLSPEGAPGHPDVRESLCPSVFAANGALSLLNLCIYLLDRQLKAQAQAFEQDGGFTERLYRKRTEARGQEWNRR